jgi:hypothetical protein
MQKISRILALVMIVGLMAAIPVGAQAESGLSETATDGSNLPMLILINRLGLSTEQMSSLHELLVGLLDSKTDAEELTGQFESSMIGFNGTEEELDALLGAYREDQKASRDALAESVQTALNDARDLLSINQGLVLRDELPRLLGLGQTLGPRSGRVQGAASIAGQRMAANAMGRVGMMTMPMGSTLRMSAEGVSDGSCEQGLLQSSSENSFWHEIASSTTPAGSKSELRVRGMQSRLQPELTSRMLQSSADRESMVLTLRDRLGSELPEMVQQRRAQALENEDTALMQEQIQSRLEQLGARMPAGMRERLSESMSGLAERVGQQMSGRLGIEDETAMMMRGQIGTALQQADHGRLFDLVKQAVNVLERKLEALE